MNEPEEIDVDMLAIQEALDDMVAGYGHEILLTLSGCSP